MYVLVCRVNIGCGRAEERILLTGLHAVADIYCSSCRTTLGWKYVSRRTIMVTTVPSVLEGWHMVLQFFVLAKSHYTGTCL